MNATSVEAYALSKGLDFTWKSASNADKAEIAMQMFFEKTSQYAGNFEKEATQTITGSIGMMKAAVSSFIAGLGNADADMTNLTSNMVDSFKTVIDNIKPIIENLVAVLPEVVTTLIDTVGDILPSLAAMVTESMPQIIATVTNIMTEMVSFVVDYLPTLLPQLMDAAVDLLQGALQAIKDNINAISETVTMLATAFVEFMTENLPLIIDVAIDIIAALTGGLISAIPELIKAIPTIIGSLVNGLFDATAQLHQVGGDLIAGMFGGMSEASDTLAEDVDSLSYSFDNLSPTLLDINDLLSANGNSIRDIDAAITESEEAITEVLKTALEENRGLREDELESISTFNDDIRALQLEKLELYRDQQLAELTKIQLEEDELTQAHAAQSLINAQEAFDQSNIITEEAYSAQLTLIENKYRAQGEVGSTAYALEQENAKTHYKESLKENKTYLADSYTAVTKAAENWVNSDITKWDLIMGVTQTATGEYSKDVVQMEISNRKAFLAMALDTKKQGGEISEDTKTTAKEILTAYTDLAPLLQDSGKDALIGLMDGMEEEIPTLKDTSKMTAEDIVNAIENELDINSPSRVLAGVGGNIVEGLWQGIKDANSWLWSNLEFWGEGIVSWIRKIFGSHSPSTVMADKVGDTIPEGIALGISRKSFMVNDAMADLLPSAISSSVNLDVTRKFTDVANSTASYSGNAGMVGAIVSGFKDAFANSEQVIILNDREFGRAVQKTVRKVAVV